MLKDNPEPKAGHFPLPVSPLPVSHIPSSIPSAPSYKIIDDLLPATSSFQQTQEQRAATLSMALKNMFSYSKEQKNG